MGWLVLLGLAAVGAFALSRGGGSSAGGVAAPEPDSWATLGARAAAGDLAAWRAIEQRVYAMTDAELDYLRRAIPAQKEEAVTEEQWGYLSRLEVLVRREVAGRAA